MTIKESWKKTRLRLGLKHWLSVHLLLHVQFNRHNIAPAPLPSMATSMQLHDPQPHLNTSTMVRHRHLFGHRQIICNDLLRQLKSLTHLSDLLLARLIVQILTAPRITNNKLLDHNNPTLHNHNTSKPLIRTTAAPLDNRIRWHHNPLPRLL